MPQAVPISQADFPWASANPSPMPIQLPTSVHPQTSKLQLGEISRESFSLATTTQSRPVPDLRMGYWGHQRSCLWAEGTGLCGIGNASISAPCSCSVSLHSASHYLQWFFAGSEGHSNALISEWYFWRSHWGPTTHLPRVRYKLLHQCFECQGLGAPEKCGHQWSEFTLEALWRGSVENTYSQAHGHHIRESG